MATLEQFLASNGWQFVDNSGDGGLFGYHAKLLDGGKAFMALSAGGSKIGDDFLYPITGMEDPDSAMVLLEIIVWNGKTLFPANLTADLPEVETHSGCYAEVSLYCEHVNEATNLGRMLESLQGWVGGTEFLPAKLKPAHTE